MNPSDSKIRFIPEVPWERLTRAEGEIWNGNSSVGARLITLQSIISPPTAQRFEPSFRRDDIL